MHDTNDRAAGIKKPYLKPQLHVHGNLVEITRTTDCLYGDYDAGTSPNFYVSGTGVCSQDGQ